jgi:signal transduction histidine kinase/ligand-binding sensor domain-containing protein/AraC-like DNA-binding protein
MNARFLYLLPIIIHFCRPLAAQPDFIPGDNENREITVRFEAIGAEQGLPHKTVQALFQDHLGFIWLGTPIGLVKYDGYTFQTYQYEPARANSSLNNLATISVNAIAEDPGGDLWLGCLFEMPQQPVLFRFDRETEQLIPYLFDERADTSIIRSDIRHIHIGQGFIWIDADRLFRIPLADAGSGSEAPEEFSYKVFGKETWEPEGKRVVSPFSISTIYEDASGRIWSPGFGGIYEWMPAQDSFRLHPISRTLPDGRREPLMIFHLVERRDGNMWAIPRGAGFLVKFEPDNGDYEVLQSPEYVFDLILLSSGKGQWWFGRHNGRGGMQVYDPGIGKNRSVDIYVEGLDFFPITRVLSLMEDASGVVWVGARDGPLLKYEPQRNQFHWLRFRPEKEHTLPHNSVNVLEQDQAGDYWMSIFGGGLTRWNRRDHTFTHFRAQAGRSDAPLTDFLTGLEVAADGKIWFGEGFSAGSYDPATGQFAHYRESGVVHSVYQDAQNRIWLAKYGGGLRRYDPEIDDFVPIGMPDPNDPSRKIFPFLGGIFQDSWGDLWLGSFSPEIGGFFRFDPETGHWETFQLPEAHDFHEDRRGHIWIATFDGLYGFDLQTEQFKRYSEQDGLPNNVVQAIEEDDRGRLWIGTDNGLSRFDPQTETFRNYFQSDGLPSDEFYFPAYKNTDGELFFWGHSGLVYFHPDSIRDNNVLPQLALTGIDLFGEPMRSEAGNSLEKHISVIQRLELSHWQNDLTFHYAALHYKNPGRNSYKVRLENYDATWREVGRQRIANYTNLDPGRYTFRVQAANSDGVWNEEGIALEIVIHPPWYWTWWSQILYLFLLTGLLLGVYRFQLNRRLALAEAGRLRELDEVKTKLYTNITHEFRTPLTVIQGIAEQITGHEEEKELIHRNSRQLLDLVNKMLDLSKIEAGKLQLDLINGDILSFLRYVVESFHSLALNQKINLNFYADVETLEMDYDPEKILQIVSNLISNAIKFTPEYGKVLVTVRQKEVDGKPTLVLKVKDTGVGIVAAQLPYIFDRFYQTDASNTRKAEGTGIGLALTKELVELMDGAIQVESKPGEGTVFTVLLPIRQTAPAADPMEIQDQDTFEEQVTTAAIALGEKGRLTLKEEMSADSDPVSETHPLLLIVEDNHDVRQYLASCLREEYKLQFARNGREGIDRALEVIPDIIISDVMMPEIDGFELCQTLKQDERTSHIPIILLTAKADITSKLEGLEYGADAYLAKPFHRAELDVRLRKLIELRRKLQARYNHPDFKPEPATEKEDAFVLKVRQLVLDNIDDPGFGIEELTAKLFLHRSQLHRKLKALTGMSTSHFIRRIRLQEGRRLLRESEMNVSEVAYAVGFSDPGYFSKLFSKEFGRPPSKV